MRTLIVIILLWVIFVGDSFSQIGSSLTKTGTTAAQFLKMGVGSRAIGMGGAFVASVDDISAIYWNPAGLAKIYNREASFFHSDWILDVNFDNASFAIGLSDFGTIGAFVSVLSMTELPVRTVDKPEGTGEFFGAGALAIGLSYARFLTEDFSIGFNAKYIREYIWNESAYGFAIDIGTLYRIKFLNETRIAASISNFGTKMKLNGRDLLVLTNYGPTGANIINTEHQVDAFDLPLLFRIGVALDLIKNDQFRLTFESNAIHPNDNTEYVNLGVEYSWNERIFLRTGYKSLFERDTEQGLTFGLGINYRMVDLVTLKFDYAFQEFHRLKDTHHLSIGLKF